MKSSISNLLTAIRSDETVGRKMGRNAARRQKWLRPLRSVYANLRPSASSDHPGINYWIGEYLSSHRMARVWLQGDHNWPSHRGRNVNEFPHWKPSFHLLVDQMHSNEEEIHVRLNRTREKWMLRVISTIRAQGKVEKVLTPPSRCKEKAAERGFHLDNLVGATSVERFSLPLTLQRLTVSARWVRINRFHSCLHAAVNLITCWTKRQW